MKRGRIGSSPSARRTLADEDLDVVRMDVGLGPDDLEQGAFGDDMTGAIDEDGEQVEGLVRERNANAVAPERPAGQVEPERRKIFHVTESNCDRNEATRPRFGPATGDEILPESYRRHGQWRSYRPPTVIQPLHPRHFVKNGFSSAGALASPVRGGSMAPLQPPGTAVGSPHFF